MFVIVLSLPEVNTCDYQHKFLFLSYRQRTSMHMAARGGDMDTVKYLVGNGGDIHMKDKAGVSICDSPS